MFYQWLRSFTKNLGLSFFCLEVNFGFIFWLAALRIAGWWPIAAGAACFLLCSLGWMGITLSLWSQAVWIVSFILIGHTPVTFGPVTNPRERADWLRRISSLSGSGIRCWWKTNSLPEPGLCWKGGRGEGALGRRRLTSLVGSYPFSKEEIWILEEIPQFLNKGN